ncbi:hypothetical protein V8G54_028257 [Vigna mungo]|uniref:Uncharacterized protein n=1 Tax=Vigna mungo TaxID=3915 RepID=A0AAQ3MS29_VIGMU
MYKSKDMFNHLQWLRDNNNHFDFLEGYKTTYVWFMYAVLATDEKYNEAIYSTAKRLVAAIDGLPDPGGPSFKDNKRESNFKTKEETEEKRGQFTLVVGGLLVIAFVVPMAQYYAYVEGVPVLKVILLDYLILNHIVVRFTTTVP